MIIGISLHTSLQSLMEFDELQLYSMYLHDMFNRIITQINITFRLICSNICSNLVCILTNKWLHFRLRYQVIYLKFLQNVVNRHNSLKHNYRKCHAHTYIFCHEKNQLCLRTLLQFTLPYIVIWSYIYERFINIC